MYFWLEFQLVCVWHAICITGIVLPTVDLVFWNWKGLCPHCVKLEEAKHFVLGYSEILIIGLYLTIIRDLV
jgi:hypothetical protein